jgi:hypothetical protein
MKVCVISNKECWQDESGAWLSSGGFPLQMEGIGSLFDAMTLVIVRRPPCGGGIPLPRSARIVALPWLPDATARRRLVLVGRLPGYLREMARAIAEADVVHTPLPGDIPFLGMLLTLLLRKRLLVRYCGSWAVTSQATRMTRIMRAWMRWHAGGRNVMLATGAGPEPPAPRMHWIFTTAITESEVVAVRPDLDRPCQSPPRVATVGRLARVKNIPCLIEAIARLREQGDLGPKVPRLAIIGDGPDRGKLEQLVQQRGCKDLIRFTGQLNREELVKELLQTDLCVQPSLSESYCKALLDAMLCGVPVMATDVGAIRHVIGGDGQRGWILPVAEPGRLADDLRRRLSDPSDWPALRRRCRAHVEAMTVEAWSERIGELCAEQWSFTLREAKLQA